MKGFEKTISFLNNNNMSSSILYSRRKLIHQLGLLGLGGLIGSNAPSLPRVLTQMQTLVLGLNAPSGQNSYSYSDLLLLSENDKVDKKRNYLEAWEEKSQWSSMIEAFFQGVLFNLNLPQGMIVEIGTYQAESFNKLCQRYGLKRCLGFEIFPYVQHPSVVIQDIRQIGSEFDRPIAFGWNNASNWEGSPRSKLAALKYLTRNIVKDGYLLEDSLPDIPYDIHIPNFKIVWQNHTLILLQRIA